MFCISTRISRLVSIFSLRIHLRLLQFFFKITNILCTYQLVKMALQKSKSLTISCTIDSTITRHQAKLFCVFAMRLIVVFIIKHSNNNACIEILWQNISLLLSILAPSISRSCLKDLSYYYKVYLEIFLKSI